MKIAVLMGGMSGEREVSLASGVQVARALRQAGHEVLAVDTSFGVLTAAQEETLLGSGIRDPGAGGEDAPAAAGGDERWRAGDLLRTGDTGVLTRDPRLTGTEVVFPALHGGSGEDGTLQTLLDLARVPYAGSGRVGCALAMDKDLSKRLFREAGIATPPWITTRGAGEAHARLGEAIQRLGLPLIVKPPSGGSTLGLTLAHDEAELRGAVAVCLDYEDRVMFEAYVRGRELTVGILGEEALPVGEIIPAHELFDYECKYRPGMAQEIFPADLAAPVARRVQVAALAVHRALGLRDFSRVDFILDGDGTPWCLEANALPGLTGNSLLPKAARAAGIPFPELCERVARMALDRAPSIRNPGAGVGV
jgi:D-alanine-D-alanine ligase